MDQRPPNMQQIMAQAILRNLNSKLPPAQAQKLQQAMQTLGQQSPLRQQQSRPQTRTPYQQQPTMSSTPQSISRSRQAVIGRGEQMPIVLRGDTSSRKPILLVLFLLILGLLPLLFGGDKASFSLPDLSLGGGGAEIGSYASQYRIASVNLVSSGTMKGYAIWQISGRVMNETGDALRGPRLSIRLIRADDTVAAEGETDLSSNTMDPDSGLSFSYQLRSGSGETLRAVVTPMPPREGAYDKP